MSRSGINRPFSWLKKVLEITEETDVPQVVSEQVRPVIDVFGWERFATPFTLTSTSPGATSIVSLPLVPDGEIHYCLAAHITHDDPVGSKDYSIMIVDAQGNQTAVTRTVGQSANFFLELDRPVVIPPGGRMRGLSRNAIAGGSNFVISGLFVRLDIGEYLPAL